MTYGAEAVLPLETSFPTLRMGTFTTSNNNELLGKRLDFIEEKRENVMIQLAITTKNSSKGMMPM